MIETQNLSCPCAGSNYFVNREANQAKWQDLTGECPRTYVPLRVSVMEQDEHTNRSKKNTDFSNVWMEAAGKS